MGRPKGTPAAASLSAEQKAQLTEVADLMLTIYQTLVKMRYIDPKALVCGPHEFDKEVLATYEKLELDPVVIYLYSIMPYVDENETDVRDFFQGGAFFNQMKIRDVERGRDPCYASPQGGFEDEEGQYMYPWYTPLSNCGNHSPIMIYDAREHRIWIVDQIQRNATDPFYCKGWYGYADKTKGKEEESTWGDSGDESDWPKEGDEDEADASEEDSDSQGSSEFWDDEDDEIETQELDGLKADQTEVVEYDEGFEHFEELSEWERQDALAIKNQNSLELARSRNAGDVLRDINKWYTELKELPGQGEYTGWMKPDILRPLYVQNGWPKQFNGDQFEVDMARKYCKERAKYFAEEPLRQLECVEGWDDYAKRRVEQAKKAVSEAKTLDEEWVARVELWQAEEIEERNLQDIEKNKVKAEKMCPGGVCQRPQDLPLWELEQSRVETQWKREAATRSQNQQSSTELDAEQIKYQESQHRRAQRKLEVYEKAYHAAQADAERLCPGKTFQETTGRKALGRQDTFTQIESTEKLVIYYKKHVKALEEFAATVPQAATQAKLAADKEVTRNKEAETSVQKRLEGLQKRLAEHGNED